MKTHLIILFFYAIVFSMAGQIKNQDLTNHINEEQRGSYHLKVEIEDALLPEKLAKPPYGHDEYFWRLEEGVEIPKCINTIADTASCLIKFVVSETGTIEDATVLKNIETCNACGEAALEILKKLTPWTPAREKGVAIKTWYVYRFVFRK